MSAVTRTIRISPDMAEAADPALHARQMSRRWARDAERYAEAGRWDKAAEAFAAAGRWAATAARNGRA